MERVIIPLSGLADWGLLAVGVLSGLHAFGLNIQPLLAVGGVSGVAIGFGAQNLTSNAISGLILYLTRPFVVRSAAPCSSPPCWLDLACKRIGVG